MLSSQQIAPAFSDGMGRGLENPVPMVVFEYYFGVLEILHRSKEKFSGTEKADEVTDAMEVMLHHIADYLEKH